MNRYILIGLLSISFPLKCGEKKVTDFNKRDACIERWTAIFSENPPPFTLKERLFGRGCQNLTSNPTALRMCYADAAFRDESIFEKCNRDATKIVSE